MRRLHLCAVVAQVHRLQAVGPKRITQAENRLALHQMNVKILKKVEMGTLGEIKVFIKFLIPAKRATSFLTMKECKAGLRNFGMNPIIQTSLSEKRKQASFLRIT